ncbi:type III restriction enzyme [Amaricoccus macauensis]|uniref:Type III restriction enzyme n=1 Tax=Amaricoccus macauensis TaxID=57001 RepID=A0A840SVY5_9RHOB|nr:hypothetical protein [Amaricoccus macauensis]MBB5223423.1 type III restriction enzyme [Amaricoccus macauensis]
METPPVFIVVCNNTTNSELVADYIAGYEREIAEGELEFRQGALELFRNFTDEGDRVHRPRTLLIDSQQIDSGEAIPPAFLDVYKDEIETFRREKAHREGAEAAKTITSEEVLREVMNTIGRRGRLGEQIRCVVSVSMLTEGWDANTVTHILGLRAFGTRLISEQVIGRALRRLSYDADPETGLFHVEYADIMGIDGLNFAAQAVQTEPKPPRETIHVHAVPGREPLEITFPRIEGYRLELPDERLVADFSALEPYILDPAKVGATKVEMAGIIGQTETLTLAHLDTVRRSTLVFRLATHLLNHTLRDANARPKLHLFPQAQAIVSQWLDSGLLVCKDGTFPAQLSYRQLADEVCELLVGAINVASASAGVVRAMLDPFDPEGTTAAVNFTTTKTDRWQPRSDRSQINWIVLDSDWEAQLAQAIENHPRVAAYAKNHNLGLEIPYIRDGEPHRYRPDYLVRLSDGTTLVLEVKGARDHDDALKAAATRDKWIPAVNRLSRFGRWAYAEMRDPFTMAEELESLVARTIDGVPA